MSAPPPPDQAARLTSILQLPIPDLLRVARMGVRLFPTIDSMLAFMSDSMADELRQNNADGAPTRWILPVGPVKQYFRLVEISNRERISWRNADIFQMDEFLDWQGRPLPADHALSFEGFMRRQVLEQLDRELRPDPARVHFPHPFRPDEMAQHMASAGGVDTCYGGIGYHGHVAFNDPPISRWFRVGVEEMRQSTTRVVMLGDDSIVVQSIGCAGGSSEMIPPMAVTIGMREILAARRLRLFLAGGERHRAILRTTLLAEPTTDYPSTLLQGHPDCVLHTDEATARPIVPSLF
jgi:glucosamine-6-phosphate deaminase